MLPTITELTKREPGFDSKCLILKLSGPPCHPASPGALGAADCPKSPKCPSPLEGQWQPWDVKAATHCLTLLSQRQPTEQMEALRKWDGEGSESPGGLLLPSLYWPEGPAIFSSPPGLPFCPINSFQTFFLPLDRWAD